jgi:hypothetical protein
MATDPKLISSLLDLSRNVDKLSGDIKKNTATTSDLVEVQEKSTEGTKDLGKVADSIKGLDLNSLKGEFSQLTKSIGGLDFKSLSTDLKSLDFKSLSKDLKSLDFKGLTEGIKGLDFKGIGDMTKGLDIKSLAGGLKEGGGIKDVVSGSLGGLLKGGKGLLGAFEKGGPVNQTGQYLVGEKGPEIVKLQQGSAVISNDILKERADILNRLGSKAPSEQEIANKRIELIKADPMYYDDEQGEEWLYSDVNDYLESLIVFGKEDLSKLSKPVSNKAEALVNPSVAQSKDSKKEKKEDDKSKLKEKKEGLFSRMFGKKKDKENEGKAEGDENKSKLGADIFAKGKDLLKDVDKTKLLSSGADLLKGAGGMFGDKLGGKLGTAGDILGVGSELSKQVKLPSLAKKAPELKTPELKTDIKKLSTPPAPKAQPKPAAAKEEVSEGKKSPTEAVSTESKTADKPAETKSEKMGDSGMTSNDIQEMKSALVRIASLLEGPLNVSPMSGPYRPDSRRV